MGAKLDFARGRWIALVAMVMLLFPTLSFAGTTGNITGYVTSAGGDPIANARVVLTSPSLQGTQTGTSDQQGFYRVFALPPGTYTATVEGPGYTKVKRENIVILVDQTIRVDVSLTKVGEGASGDVIVITEQAPIVEQGSTTVGANLSGDFLNQVPTGRRLSTVLALTPGATTDQLGTSFLGASSPENAVVIDGLNTTGVDYGLVSSNVPIEFIDQLEVKTAGYGAEYGRATGAFINTILKQGGNEFHGDVFVYVTPIQGNPEPSVYASGGGDPITRSDQIKLDMDVGFDLGGYIIKDKLWFFAGFMPRIRQDEITRTLGDETRTYDASTLTGYYVGKLTYRVNEDNTVALTVLGNPTNYSGPVGTTAEAMRGDEATYMFDKWKTSQFDGSLRWNSKLKDDTINIELLLGYHREREVQTPYGVADSTEGAGRFSGTGGYDNMFTYQKLQGVDADPGLDPADAGDDWAAPTCNGTPGDCRVFNHREGGFGYLEDATRERATATLRVTHYINNVVGNHKFLWGGDFEYLQYDNTRAYTSTYFTRVTGYNRERYFATAGDDAAACAAQWPQDEVLLEAVPSYYWDENGTQYDNGVACLLNFFPAVTNNLNASAFVQESWSILDNLTLNLGVRWEMQQLRSPRKPDGSLGDVNLGVYNNWAPRLGFIFDPTNEGRSKIFGSYGRYFENIPMDINDRAFSYEGLAYYYKDLTGTTPLNMLDSFGLTYYPNPLILGGTTTPIQNDIKSQYSNEFLLGVQYELAHNLAIEAQYIDRRLGSIIEDISPDDGNNYIIANPGPPLEGGTSYYDPNTGSDFAIYDYMDPADPSKGCKVDYIDEAGTVVESFEDLPCFPEATRTYQGLMLSGRKNFSDGWTLLTSYTLSWTYGNYPGLFTPENGQLDPNITSQFDLPDLLTNRQGFLPQDHRHSVKVHGSYNWDFGLRTGAGLFIQSGAPYSALGAHAIYDDGEAFLSPRGTAGRTPTTASLDGNIEYFLPLGEQRSMSFQVEAFNVLNSQNAIRVDQNYTYATAYNPQDGQTIDQALCEYSASYDADGVINYADGQIAYCSEMANPNFGQPTAYQAPFALRLGVKFTF